MKLFADPASCFGGSAVKLVAPSPQEHEDNDDGVKSAVENRLSRSTSSATTTQRRRRKLAASSNWKPALSSISEDENSSSTAFEKIGDAGGVAKTPSSQESVFTRLRFKLRKSDHRVKRPSYWKESIPMALPAFAPAPFMF